VPTPAAALPHRQDPVLRAADIVVAGTAGVVAAPVAAAVAVLIRLVDGPPVLYRGRRLGRGGVPFTMYKFRTLKTGAEGRLGAHYGDVLQAATAAETTRTGTVLRATQLDELPQLFNVLRGDMSIVGPRPLPQRDYERLEEWHRKRNLVLPGMTGLWQVSGRSELDFDELVRLDFLYLERWSVWLDLSIMLKTLPAVIRTRGAW